MGKRRVSHNYESVTLTPPGPIPRVRVSENRNFSAALHAMRSDALPSAPCGPCGGFVIYPAPTAKHVGCSTAVASRPRLCARFGGYPSKGLASHTSRRRSDAHPESFLFLTMRTSTSGPSGTAQRFLPGKPKRKPDSVSRDQASASEYSCASSAASSTAAGGTIAPSATRPSSAATA
eukprot:751355-Prymnesium_polylepis.1